MPDYARIFTGLGKYAKLARQLEDLASRTLTFSGSGETFTSLDSLKAEFAAVLGDDRAERERLSAAGDMLDDFSTAILGLRERGLLEADRFIETVVRDELDAPASTALDVSRRLSRAMLRDQESVLENPVTLFAASGAAGLVGTGHVALKALADLGDGALVPDERLRSGTFTLRCESDQWRDLATPGQERMRLTAESGASVTFSVIPDTASGAEHALNRVLDGGFQAKTAGGAPQFWTIASGASIVSLGSASEAYLGTSCLKFSGDGSTAAKVQQSLAGRTQPVAPGDAYAVHARIRTAGVAAGEIEVRLQAGGYVSAGRVSIASGYPAAYQAFSFFEVLPRAPKTDLSLSVALSSGVDGTVFVDHMAMALPAEIPGEGVKIAVFRGDVDFVAGANPDRLLARASAVDAGRFQTFLRERHGVALPSSAAPTIDDALAR